jgi:general secretion pathway protein G
VSARSAEAGFTLVEMLVVITIIGLIMGLVGPRVLSYLSDSKVKTAKIQIQGFSSALDLFYLDSGRYPTSNEGLSALTQKPSGATTWNGPYLNGGSVPNDPWGRPYVYKVPGQHGPYEVVSLGPDGQSDLTVAGNTPDVSQ